MKYKYLLSLIAFIAISESTFAQYANDAIRFSGFQPGSTSRIKGIGNAGTAVGGDLSSVAGNPAGLGFFTRSEANITPEFDGSSVKSTYLGTASSSTKGALNLNNAAIVFYSRLNTPSGNDKGKGWLSLNFGLGYNRTNDFGQRINYSGKNSNSSISDYYAALANGDGLVDGTLQSWAHNQNLIDLYNTTPPAYKSNAFPGVNQMNNIIRSGSQSEFDLSLGANYSNRLYLGVSLGIPDVQYHSINNFNELGSVSVLENGVGVQRNFNSTYSQVQDTKGNGFNAKFGVIYKLLDNVRIGALITTPTFITVDDSYSEGLTNTLSNGRSYENGPTEYPLTYNLRTPFKAAGGISVFFNQYGFISGDVEYVDYSSTHLGTNDDYDGSYDNNIIKNTYQAAINAHVGAEIKVTSAIALRAGYGIQGSALKTNGTPLKTATAGLGYRFGDYYVDAAYMHLSGAQTVTPYTFGTQTPVANLNTSNNNVFVTVGFRY
ncbi:MAG TPA: hypothetical protein VL490_08030 [Mucilaginibacter sp.]|jgi:hypothetical protein|nr:hypothetical protein [Mucilaginibacter sp.]